MSKYYKHKLGSFYLLGAFDGHFYIKDKILKLIEDNKYETLQEEAGVFSNRITKLDWSSGKDLNREWAKFCYPILQEELTKIINQIGYVECHIEDLWFQQYYHNDTHAWHVHGHNFTFVYYLELDEHSPKTELIDPADQNKIIIPDIKEGDILIFPSYVIHRAPVINNNIRKTIISANITAIDPNVNTIPIINTL